MDPVEPTLKVTDRRHFTADGQLKNDAPPENAAPVESARPEPPTGEPLPREPRHEGSDVAFANFLLSLGAQAADLIGGPEPELAGARQIIAVLEMLKDKTEGRRTPDESRILDGILFDLRLAFVSSAKGSVS